MRIKIGVQAITLALILSGTISCVTDEDIQLTVSAAVAATQESIVLDAPEPRPSLVVTDEDLQPTVSAAVTATQKSILTELPEPTPDPSVVATWVPGPSFTMGSSEAEVSLAQGSLDGIVTLVNDGDNYRWIYDTSFVEFNVNTRTVVGWDNTDRDLRLLPKVPAGDFTIGSTFEQVLVAQGNPDSVDTVSIHPEWYYGSSFVQFNIFDGTVIGWDDKGGLNFSS